MESWKVYKKYLNHNITPVCLAIPGKIKKIDKKTNTALVDFNGIERDVNVSLVDVRKGDYVIVHAGYAIQKIDQKEAEETLKLFEKSKLQIPNVNSSSKSKLQKI